MKMFLVWLLFLFSIGFMVTESNTRTVEVRLSEFCSSRRKQLNAASCDELFTIKISDRWMQMNISKVVYKTSVQQDSPHGVPIMSHKHIFSEATVLPHKIVCGDT
jgi:hypothetical protein